MAERLIDEKTLREKLYEWCGNHCNNRKGCQYCEVSEIIDIVEEMPTIEAKPVVCCKDCEYFNPHCQSCFLHWQEDDDPNVFCFQTNPDDYCSFAEKRDNK